MDDTATTVAVITAVVGLLTAVVTGAVALINLRQTQEARRAATAGAASTADALNLMAAQVDDLSSTIDRRFGPAEAQMNLLVNLLRDLVGRLYPSERD